MRTLTIALALAAGAPLFAQDPPVGPPLPHGPGGGEQEARKEMIALFQSVETRLKEIDELLYDASSGRRGLDGADESVIGELLSASSGKSDEVLSGIDRILEIAEQFGQGQGGSGGSVEQAMGSGDSPLDGQPQGEQGQKEQVPQVEDSKQPGEQEQQGQQDPQGSDRPGGQRPDDPGEEPSTRPENRDASSQPPAGETGRVQVTDTTERWGDLPVHVRDLFRNEGGGELPAQYRDWIDGYYRRLNRRK